MEKIKDEKGNIIAEYGSEEEVEINEVIKQIQNNIEEAKKQKEQNEKVLKLSQKKLYQKIRKETKKIIEILEKEIKINSLFEKYLKLELQKFNIDERRERANEKSFKH